MVLKLNCTRLCMSYDLLQIQSKVQVYTVCAQSVFTLQTESGKNMSDYIQ